MTTQPMLPSLSVATALVGAIALAVMGSIDAAGQTPAQGSAKQQVNTMRIRIAEARMQQRDGEGAAVQIEADIGVPVASDQAAVLS
jgi:hypothetical protein